MVAFSSLFSSKISCQGVCWLSLDRQRVRGGVVFRLGVSKGWRNFEKDSPSAEDPRHARLDRAGVLSGIGLQLIGICFFDAGGKRRFGF